MMTRSVFRLLAPMALLGTLATAQATTVLYADATGYGAALTALGIAGAQVSADINAFAAANGVSDTTIFAVGDDGTPNAINIAPATLTGLNPGTGIGFVLQNTYGIADAFYSHQLTNGTATAVQISFAAPVTAFAFVSNVLNFTVDGSTANTPLTLTTSNGDVLSGFTTPLYYGGIDLGTAPLAFNGVVSSTPFSSITLSTTGQAFDITGFSVVAAAPVPEPGSYVLLLAGLGVGAMISRRRSTIGSDKLPD